MIKKVGFSASRCIYDIVTEKVEIYDVVMITTGTDCPTLDQWLNVMKGYASLPVWDERSLAELDPKKVEQVAKELWQTGKVHQPRVYGGYRTKSPYVWMDLVHTKEDRDANPILARAWQHAQTIEGLVTPIESDNEVYDMFDDVINEISELTAEETDDLNENKPNE